MVIFHFALLQGVKTYQKDQMTQANEQKELILIYLITFENFQHFLLTLHTIFLERFKNST